jgi:hypothetical protein
MLSALGGLISPTQAPRHGHRTRASPVIVWLHVIEASRVGKTRGQPAGHAPIAAWHIEDHRRSADASAARPSSMQWIAESETEE